jgi:hypothetical protein
MVNVFHIGNNSLYKANTYHSSFTVRGTRVSNPISYPHLRLSASIITWKRAFAASIPLSFCGYQPYSKYYLNLYLIQAFKYLSSTIGV